MACSCSDASPGAPSVAAAGGMRSSGGGGAVATAGMPFEPFRRQVLLGQTGGPMSYYSDTFDVRDWKSLTWWLDVSASLPAVVSNPATLYLQTSEDINFKGFVDLIPGGTSPNIGEIATGLVTNPGRYLRVRLDIAQDETTIVASSLVARKR